MPTSTTTERRSSFCFILDGTRPRESANTLLGGKAAATDRLISAGYTVPASAAVTTEAYRAAAGHPSVVALLERIARNLDDVTADEVDAVFLVVPVPKEVEQEILHAAHEIAAGAPLAARSSATVEDLAGTSFAGQYRSYLSLESDADVLRSVRLVWASLWHPAPCAYRRAHGVDESQIAMAVLLMRMVPSVQAGVAFTRDPQGAEGVRVEAVEGLGEQLVSGDVTPHAWVVTSSSGGADVPDVVPNVARVAQAIEGTFGMPMDVEWVWDGARLWIVQARPITVSVGRDDGFDTPLDGSTLTTAGIAEMLPGVLPPRIWQLAGFAVEEALRQSVDALGALGGDLVQPFHFVRRVRGRAALDLDALKRVAAAIPGGSEDEVEQQYFGTASGARNGATAKPPRRWAPGVLLHDARVLRARRYGVEAADIVVQAAAELRERPPDLAALDDDALAAYRRRLVLGGARAMAAELAVAAAAAAAFRRLELTIARHLGEREAARWVQRITTGIPLPAPHPGASMSVFGGPTWAEAGVVADPRTPSASRRTTELRELETTLQSLPKWKAARVMTGQVVDVRIHVLRRLAIDAVAMLGRRERTKAAVLGFGGAIRAADLELGRRLVAAGVLEDVPDVDFLSTGELVGAVAAPTAAEVARRRRWIGRCDEDGPLPERFVGRPDPVHPPVPSGDTLCGTGGSPGRYTARARAVRAPVRSALRDGEILVAEATDAGWSPLFLHAGTIVVERGGPLSHAAIVARELGVPAVLDVPGAVARLDGHIVTVDGDIGVVIVRPDGGAEGGSS